MCPRLHLSTRTQTVIPDVTRIPPTLPHQFRCTCLLRGCHPRPSRRLWRHSRLHNWFLLFLPLRLRQSLCRSRTRSQLVESESTTLSSPRAHSRCSMEDVNSTHTTAALVVCCLQTPRRVHIREQTALWKSSHLTRTHNYHLLEPILNIRHVTCLFAGILQWI